MALPPTIALLRPVFPDQDFSATSFGLDSGHHFGPFDDRLANAQALSARDEQYSIKLDFVANLIW